MGQLNRWIIATKWAKENTKKECGYDSFWTPIGSYTRIPYSFASEAEAMSILKDIADFREGAEGAIFSVMEVRYVPNKIKSYNEDWFKKYCVGEKTLKVERTKK